MSEEAPGAAQAVAIPAQLLTNPTPSQMLMLAIERGDGLDKLERLMALQQQWEANEARKAFTRAMADFKADPPTIVKDKRVGYENRDGTFTGYKHPSLAQVATKIAAALSRVGISHAWDVQHAGGMVTVSCTLTHQAGHKETITMPPAKPDDSGKKNAIQQVASAITYMQRYSLLAITGLAAEDQDDDGQASGEAPACITADQVRQLEAECTRVGADRAAFLRYINVDRFAQVLAANFDAVMAELQRKKAMAGGKGGTRAPQRKSAAPPAATRTHSEALTLLCSRADVVGVAEGQLLDRYDVAELGHLTFDQIDDALAWLGQIHAP